MRIGLTKDRSKMVCAVGFGAILVAFLAGLFSGSYSITAHRERCREIRELRIQNFELSRSISEEEHRLAALRREDVPGNFRCRLPGGHRDSETEFTLPMTQVESRLEH